jgi:hypothetical protein
VAWDDWEVSVTEKNEHHDSKFWKMSLLTCLIHMCSASLYQASNNVP